MYRKLLFLTFVIVGIFFALAVFAQTCPHVYEGINCGANWYCNGCQTSCPTCPGGAPGPANATVLNSVSCACNCAGGEIICSGLCTAPDTSCPADRNRENASTCPAEDGCGACKAGYSPNPAAPNSPNACIKAAYMDFLNSGYFQVSGNITSTSGDVGGTRLCIGADCRATWPEAVSAFVDEGNVGFGPTAVLGTNDNTPLSFEINNVGRIYIDTAGNVGIGTTTPSYNLVVSGASPREYIWATSGNPELDLGDGTNHWSIYRDTATDQLRFWRTNDRMAITSSGNVGLGTISPASKLSILGNLAVGAAYVGLVGPGDGAIIQGNVGIGTSSPAYKLDVAGQANANQLCIAGDCRGVWPGATPPGGSDTQVQFNDGGVFGGSWGLTYDKAVSNLSVGGPLMVGGTIGVNGLGANSTVGIQSRGSTSGGYFASSVASGYVLLGQGDYGVNAYGNSFGLYGSGGAYGVYGNGSSYGVYGSSNNTGVYGYGSIYGVYGTTSFAAADAGYFYNTNTGAYARLGSSTWAGYFWGNTYVSGNETIAGTSTVGSNLRIGSNSSADDDYIYFDDGTKYIKWEEGMGRFNAGSGLFVNGQLTGLGGINTLSGNSILAYDSSGQKAIRIRHDSTNGIVEPYTTFGVDTGDLVLQSTYAGRNVTVNDDLAVAYGATVGGVANKGSGTLNAAQLCINGICQSSWPSGGTPGGANTNVQFNNGGAFGGNAGLTYNSGTFALTVGGLLTTGSLTIDSLSGVLKASGGAVSGGATTSDLAEGANLYYTDARARAAISAGAGPVNYTPATGVLSFSSPLAVLYGGTGGSATPTAGAVAYGNGSAYTFTAAGSSGQFLQSNGSAAPTWTNSLNASNLTSGTVAVARGGTGLSSTPAAGQLLIGTGAAYSLANLIGTANRITVTNGAGSITLSAPQDIATTSSPTFAATTLSGNLSADSNTQGPCTWHAVSALPATLYDLSCPDGKFLAGLSFSAASGGYVDEIKCCEL